MARIAEDGDDAARSGGKLRTETQGSERPDAARFVPHVSGVFEKPSLPAGKSQATQGLPDQFERVGAGELERPVVVRTRRGSRAGRLRQLAGGAVVLMVAAMAPDISESLDRGEAFTLEVSAAQAAATPAIMQPLMQIRRTFGEAELYVGGRRVPTGNEELTLLKLLVEPPHKRTYGEVEQRIWPGVKGDVGEWRRVLVKRVNRKLRQHLDRVGAHSEPGAPRNMIWCEAGWVRLDPWAFRASLAV